MTAPAEAVYPQAGPRGARAALARAFRAKRRRSRGSGTGSRANRGRSDAGFTLVELLVALTLLGMIMAYFSGAFLTVRRVEALSGRVERGALVETVAAHLRRSVEGAVPVLAAGEDGERYVLAFDGAADRIRFVAPSDGRLDIGGLVRVELALGAAADGAAETALWETRQVFRPAGGAVPAATRHLLLEDAEALAFRYYGTPAPTEPPGWHEAWTRPDALPLVVEVSFRTSFDGDPATRTLSAALHAAR